MKSYLLFFFILTSICLTNCNKSPSPAIKTGPNVYVCGYANLASAVYWKDGTEVVLGNAFNATDISLSGSDIYVAGNIGFSLPSGGGANAAVYWKNGTMVRLGNDPPYANSIAVSGSDIYVCGYATINNT